MGDGEFMLCGVEIPLLLCNGFLLICFRLVGGWYKMREGVGMRR